MSKSKILTLVSVCILMLTFSAAGDVGYVLVDTDGDCDPDLTAGPITLGSGWTALDLLDYVYDIDYTVYEWGAFVTTIEEVTPVWDPPEHQDWWMFAYLNSSVQCHTMSPVTLDEFPMEDGDTIGMWFVSGNLTAWPCSC